MQERPLYIHAKKKRACTIYTQKQTPYTHAGTHRDTQSHMHVNNMCPDARARTHTHTRSYRSEVSVLTSRQAVEWPGPSGSESGSDRGPARRPAPGAWRTGGRRTTTAAAAGGAPPSPAAAPAASLQGQPPAPTLLGRHVGAWASLVGSSGNHREFRVQTGIHAQWWGGNVCNHT